MKPTKPTMVPQLAIWQYARLLCLTDHDPQPALLGCLRKEPLLWNATGYRLGNISRGLSGLTGMAQPCCFYAA